jgi:hypothetical protein
MFLLFIHGVYLSQHIKISLKFDEHSTSKKQKHPFLHLGTSCLETGRGTRIFVLKNQDWLSGSRGIT